MTEISLDDMEAEVACLIQPDTDPETVSVRVRGDKLIALLALARRSEPAPEGVEMGLRQAAEICRQQAREFLDPGYATGQPLSSFNERFACDECAKAIEAAALSLQATRP